MMKITYNVALYFHPIFILLNQPFGAILDFGFLIAASGPWGHKGLRSGGICCIALLYHFILN
jgi:hypothetical protein